MDWTCTFPGPRNTTPSLFAMIYCVPPRWHEMQLMIQRCDLSRADEVEQLEEFTGRCSRPTHDLRWEVSCSRDSCVERVTAKTGTSIARQLGSAEPQFLSRYHTRGIGSFTSTRQSDGLCRACHGSDCPGKKTSLPATTFSREGAVILKSTAENAGVTTGRIASGSRAAV
jgi:hypothetical protein